VTKATVKVKDTHLDSTAVAFLFPTHYSTIPHERDVIYVFLYTQTLWKHRLENWIFTTVYLN